MIAILSGCAHTPVERLYGLKEPIPACIEVESIDTIWNEYGGVTKRVRGRMKRRDLYNH